MQSLGTYLTSWNKLKKKECTCPCFNKVDVQSWPDLFYKNIGRVEILNLLLHLQKLLDRGGTGLAKGGSGRDKDWAKVGAEAAAAGKMRQVFHPPEISEVSK